MSELQRYGLEWKSDTDFIATPMSDGYWTPWHIAQERLTTTQAENEALREGMRKVNATAERHEREMYIAKDEAEEKGRVLVGMCRDLKARVAELEADNAHQRERRNAARDCIQKMKAESLRKQAEAVEKFGQEIGVFDSEYDDQEYVEIPRREVKAYAQRLRQQADEAERAGGEHA